MDISTPIIFFGIFLIACLSLFLVFKFGIKEKSYEEALAEQRQHTNALLGVKAKPKEKKNKKNTKKPKEKQQPNDEPNEEIIEAPQKLHVAFKSEPEELAPKENSPIKKTIKREKIRPILINRDIAESVIKPDKEVTTANHFEIIHPKDAVELLRSNSKEDLVKEVKEKPVKEKKPVELKKSKPITESAPVIVEKIEKKEEKKVESAPPAPSTTLPVNTGKEKKKKKSEFNTLQQLTAERDGLFTLVRRAELSRNEIQTLIELLLNKQHDAPIVVDEWTEGKSDPVPKLKKQLADKEKQLAEEREASLAFQAKIREIRSEQQSEKSVLNQRIRSLEEALNAKHVESESHYNRLQGVLQNVQVLQAQCADEARKHQLAEEEKQVLLNQLKQLELRIAQGQENENHAVIQLRAEIQLLTMENAGLLESQQARMSDLTTLQVEVEQLRLINKQLEETRQGLEMEVGNKIRNTDEITKEISHLNTSLHQQIEENRKAEYNLGQIQRQLENEKAEAAKLIAQLKEELQKERDASLKTKQESQKTQAELQKIKQDYQELESSQIKGSTVEKTHKVELLNLNNQLSSIQSELQQTKVELTESANKNQQLQKEVEEQKAKNNDLRQKNWKVMEALNIAESRSKSSSGPKQSDVSLDLLTKSIITREQDSQKQFIQRLFPEIVELKAASSNEDWQTLVAELIENYIENLRRQSSVVPKLQAELANFETNIDKTMRDLQSNVAEQELNWRAQLEAKDAEIQILKEEKLKELKIKLEEQEFVLQEERAKVQALTKECSQLKQSKPSNGADAATTIERLTEEVNRLNTQLQTKKSADVNGSPKEQNFKATNGLSLNEHSLSSSSTSLTSSEVTHNNKSKNKKKKKKGAAK